MFCCSCAVSAALAAVAAVLATAAGFSDAVVFAETAGTAGTEFKVFSDAARTAVSAFPAGMGSTFRFPIFYDSTQPTSCRLQLCPVLFRLGFWNF